MAVFSELESHQDISNRAEVLRLRDEGWKKQKKEIFLESGTYRLMTATRLPNGTVHAAACQFFLLQENIGKYSYSPGKVI